MDFTIIKGAPLRGFSRFLAQTILKLIIANLIHSEHYLSGSYYLNSQRENKSLSLISIFWKKRGNNLKSLASNFQVAVCFHPGHLQPKTLANSFSILI